MVTGGVSFSLEVVYERLQMGSKESAYLLWLTEKFPDRIKELAELTRQLFNIQGLSDEETALIGLGYARGQRTFRIESMYVSQYDADILEREIKLEEDAGKLSILKSFLGEEVAGERKRKGKGRRKGI